MLHRLGVGQDSNKDRRSEGLTSDLFPTEGPIGMKTLVEPLDPNVEYVPTSINSEELLTLLT